MVAPIRFVTPPGSVSGDYKLFRLRCRSSIRDIRFLCHKVFPSSTSCWCNKNDRVEKCTFPLYLSLPVTTLEMILQLKCVFCDDNLRLTVWKTQYFRVKYSYCGKSTHTFDASAFKLAFNQLATVVNFDCASN